MPFLPGEVPDFNPCLRIPIPYHFNALLLQPLHDSLTYFLLAFLFFIIISKSNQQAFGFNGSANILGVIITVAQRIQTLRLDCFMQLPGITHCILPGYSRAMKGEYMILSQGIEGCRQFVKICN